MSIGIECLLSETDAGAVVLAEQLDGINKARRSIEDEMKDQAIEIVKAAVASNSESTKTEKYGVCLYNASWHQGVVGIIASRIKDRVHRPTIAFAKVSDTEIKGSARSIHGLHIRDALDAIATANPGLIDKFGGHAMAAGLSLPLARFAEFAALFDAEARKGLSKGDLEQQVVSDGELEGEFNLATARKIAEAAPWGQGFPEPVFDGEFEIIDQRILGGRHLKLRLLKDDELRLLLKQSDNLKDLLHNSTETEIANIIYKYGEERGSRKIAKSIFNYIKKDKMETNLNLVESVGEAVPKRYLNKTLSRVFQSFRIKVNNELENIVQSIIDAIHLLEPKGRLAVITFHSLEDRLVKNIFKDFSRGGDSIIKSMGYNFPQECMKIVNVLTKKPISPNWDEIKKNKRSRSAKLRVVEKI